MGWNNTGTEAAKQAVIKRWEIAIQHPVNKPCPFCGKTSAIVEQDKTNEELYLVKCRECYAVTYRAQGADKAIELWNNESFPDYILLTNKDKPYIDDPEVWGNLKNAVVLSVFDEYKKQKKLAMKSWSSSPVMYDEHLRKARMEKKFFEDESFTFFSTIPGDTVIDAADKQAKYDVLFREKYNCRGCGNDDCEHQHYIWWLWDKGNNHDKCLGRKKRTAKKRGKLLRTDQQSYLLVPR